jgi:hypothetical protein
VGPVEDEIGSAAYLNRLGMAAGFNKRPFIGIIGDNIIFNGAFIRIAGSGAYAKIPVASDVKCGTDV